MMSSGLYSSLTYNFMQSDVVRYPIVDCSSQCTIHETGRRFERSCHRVQQTQIPTNQPIHGWSLPDQAIRGHAVGMRWYAHLHLSMAALTPSNQSINNRSPIELDINKNASMASTPTPTLTLQPEHSHEIIFRPLFYFILPRQQMT